MDARGREERDAKLAEIERNRNSKRNHLTLTHAAVACEDRPSARDWDIAERLWRKQCPSTGRRPASKPVLAQRTDLTWYPPHASPRETARGSPARFFNLRLAWSSTGPGQDRLRWEECVTGLAPRSTPSSLLSLAARLSIATTQHSSSLFLSLIGEHKDAGRQQRACTRPTRGGLWTRRAEPLKLWSAQSLPDYVPSKISMPCQSVPVLAAAQDARSPQPPRQVLTRAPFSWSTLYSAHLEDMQCRHHRRLTDRIGGRQRASGCGARETKTSHPSSGSLLELCYSRAGAPNLGASMVRSSLARSHSASHTIFPQDTSPVETKRASQADQPL